MVEDMKVSFRLKRGRDDLIISWLKSLSSHDRSYYIRERLKNSLIYEEHSAQVSNNHGLNKVIPEIKPNNNKRNSQQKTVSEISEAELEKNLKGWSN